MAYRLIICPKQVPAIRVEKAETAARLFDCRAGGFLSARPGTRAPFF
jgi:hypothetical protein